MHGPYAEISTQHGGLMALEEEHEGSEYPE